jgi:hypothetical protein
MAPILWEIPYIHDERVDYPLVHQIKFHEITIRFL